MNVKLRPGICRLSQWACMALLTVLAVTTASAQPNLNLPPGSVTPTITFSSTLSLPSYFEAQFPSAPSGYDVNSLQTYLSWCVQANEALDLSGPGPTLYSESTASYVLYNTYPNSALPSPDQSPNWPMVNYILNHKNGASVADIQEAIWFLLDGTYHANSFIGSGPFPTPGTTALLTDAAVNGASFVPTAGQVVAVLLYGNTDTLNADGNDPQDLIIEVPVPTPPGGTIGDFVWRDTNKNGIQDCGETGLNGVTVQLYQNSIAPGNLVATTTTGPAPSGYTSNYALACQTDGYYQFTGLAPGSYIVAIPGSQAILNNLVLTLPLQGANTAVDSNGIGGTPGYSATATVNVPSATTVDETIDFGYYGPINPSTTLTTKSVSPGTTVEPNTTMTVIVTETNTGDSMITNVSVAGGGACTSFSPSSIPSLAPGSAQDFTCTFNSGNTSGSWTAAATGLDAAGNPAPTTDESTSGNFTVIHPATSLTTKSVSPGTSVEPNTTVMVVVTETNTGDSAISNVSVAGGGSCASFTPASVGSLGPGASQDFTCTFNSGTASGSWTAAASGTDAAGNPAPSVGESTSGSFTVIHPATTLTTKSVSPGTTVEANTTVTVIVTETNTGDSAISNVSVAGGGSCASFTPASVGSLAPGASQDFTCTFNSGTASGSWTAAASGTDAAGKPAPTTNESTSGNFTVIHPATALTTKSVSPGTTVEANTTVTVVVTETNTGDSAITNVSVAGGGSCASFTPASVASLAPGGSQDFTCTFNSGAASGSWTAAASGTDAAGKPAPTANESTSGNFTVIHASTMLTTKSVSPGTSVEPNTTITVVVTEKNTGDTAITNVSVGGGGSCASFTPASVASLAPGASQDFTCSFSSGTTSGSWTAAASGTDSLGNPAPSAGESTSGNFTVIHPATTLTTKSVSPGTMVETNTTVTVIVTEKNTGDTPITNVKVTGGGSCTIFTPASVASLAAGASQDFTCTFNSGTTSGSWTAAASATDAAGNPAPSAGESTSGNFTVIHPSTSLTTYSVSPGTTVNANTTIAVVVTEKNTGDSTLTNVKVAGGGSCASFTPSSVSSLAAGATANFTCSFNSGTTSGSWSASATATDALGNAAPSAGESTSGSFTVLSKCGGNCTTITAYKGVAITPVTLTGSGGAGGAYKFSATGLPSGLSISSSGTISGTPTVTGTFNYTVTITDKNGQNAGTINCTVIVKTPSTPVCSVYDNASPPYMVYQDTGVGLVKFNVTTNLNNNFNVTVSPTPSGATFSPAAPSQPYPMPSGEVITFPATTQSIKFIAQRINSKASAQLTVTATNAAGNTVTCDPISTVLSSLSWQSGLNGVQTFSNLPQSTDTVEITNGNPGLSDLLILVNGVPFLEYKMTNGQTLSVDVSKAMKAGNNNTIMLVGIGFSPNSSAQIVVSQ